MSEREEYMREMSKTNIKKRLFVLVSTRACLSPLLCFYNSLSLSLILFLSLKLAIEENQQASVREIMGSEEENSKSWPPWLKPLLQEKFFVQCKLHADSHKSECNMYCLDCTNGPLCSFCLSFHKDHHAIQIRRSSYHDVIRVSEIQKFLDITGVQTYVINSAKVVFLNERPQPRPGKGVVNTCQVCYRSLVDSFRFCSLGCKISGTSKNFDKKRKDWTNNLSDSDDSYSSTTTSNGRLKKNSDMINNNSFTPSTPPLSAVNGRIVKRRKGIPHRAPFGGLIIEY
ncbi:unnamed protein product [Brassica oleracea]